MRFVLHLLLIAVLGVLYLPTIRELIVVWRTDTYAGHGMFVPAFSAVLLWLERERLRAAAGHGHAAGFVIVAAAVGLLALGRVSSSLLLQGLSVAVLVAGLAVFAFGPRLLRAAAFPIALLVFMAPLPREAVGAVTEDIQAFVAGFAAGALDLIGIPVYREGMLLHLPRTSLEVAEICNGLRFLMALLVLTLAFAYVTQRTIPRRAVLVASAVPIAILANAVRVAAISLAVYYIGPQAASGFIHDWIGKGVWVLTLLPLIGLAILLRWTTPPGGPTALPDAGEVSPDEPAEVPASSRT